MAPKPYVVDVLIHVNKEYRISAESPEEALARVSGLCGQEDWVRTMIKHVSVPQVALIEPVEAREW